MLRFSVSPSLPLLLQSNPELAEAIVQNTRRYVTIFSDAVSELLPTYKQKEVSKNGGLTFTYFKSGSY